MDDERRRSSPPSSSSSSTALSSSSTADEVTLHWTVSEPLTEECDPCDAVAREAGVCVDMAKELLDMGAVYVDTWPEGRGKSGSKVKWQRLHSPLALSEPLQPGKDDGVSGDSHFVLCLF